LFALFPKYCQQSLKINLFYLGRRTIDTDFSKEFIDELKRLNANVGDHLLFYILQDIQDFYRQVFRRFKKAVPFPKDVKIVEDLRHQTTAHINAKNPAEIANLCIDLENIGGFREMYVQWVEFKNNLYRAIRKGELKL
jgi:hypothetical protein